MRNLALNALHLFLDVIDVKEKSRIVRQRQVNQPSRTRHPLIPSPILAGLKLGSPEVQRKTDDTPKGCVW